MGRWSVERAATNFEGAELVIHGSTAFIVYHLQYVCHDRIDIIITPAI